MVRVSRMPTVETASARYQDYWDLTKFYIGWFVKESTAAVFSPEEKARYDALLRSTHDDYVEAQKMRARAVAKLARLAAREGMGVILLPVVHINRDPKDQYLKVPLCGERILAFDRIVDPVLLSGIGFRHEKCTECTRLLLEGKKP